MDIVAHALSTSINGYKAEVLVNDVPLIRTAAGPPQQGTVHATPWTVDGVNELRMVIEGAPHESGAGGRASAELVEGLFGQILRPGEVKRLASIDWIQPTDGERPLPTSISQNFSLSGRPRWAWQDARPVSLAAPAERARVVSFVRDIHDHFAAKRVSALLDCMTSRMSEAPYYGATPTEARTAFERDFWVLAGLPDYEIVPYDEADLDLRPVAWGKVILVQRKDGSPLLQCRAGSSKRGAFPLFLAHVKNGLEIVRTA